MRNPAKSGDASAGGQTVPIEMPRLSTEEGTATLSAWLVAVGDRVAKGDLVAELETDKATVELEAPVEGQIEALLVKAGSEGLKPGALLGHIRPATAVVESVESGAARSEQSPPAPLRTPTGSPGVSQSSASSESPTLSESAGLSESPALSESPGRSVATPLARRLAQSEGIDLGRVTGTGVGGRIEKADVERSASPSTASAAVARAVAPASTRAVAPGSDRPRPGVQLGLRCRVDAILAARARLNAGLDPNGAAARVTLNDFVVRAAALALRAVPAANHRRVGEAGEPAEAVDVAIVVAAEGPGANASTADGAAGGAGPRVFVVRDADRKGLAVLSSEIRSLAADARAAAAAAQGDSAASLLVTSFARFGIESAHPMLPADQLCVLAVGAVVEEPVVRDGAVAIGSNLALTLVFDPAVFGGAVGAELLAAIRMRLEDPLGMVL